MQRSNICINIKLIIIYIIYLHKIIYNFIYYIRSTTGSTLFVLNCVSQKSISYESFFNTMQLLRLTIFFEGVILIPYTIYTDNFVLFYTLTIILHILPAVLIDLTLKFSGRRPM